MMGCETPGIKEHYECNRCGKYFWDEYAGSECTPAEVYLAPTGHDLSTKVSTFTGPCGSITEHYYCSDCDQWVDTVTKTAYPKEAFYGSGYDPSAIHDYQVVTDGGGNKIPNPSGPGYLYECTKCHQQLYMDPKG